MKNNTSSSSSSRRRSNLFSCLDVNLVRHILIEYTDCASLVSLSFTCRYFHSLVSLEGGVTDELLFRISPLLTPHRQQQQQEEQQHQQALRPQFSTFNQNKGQLHAIHFYEQIRRAKREFMVSCGEDHTIAVRRTAGRRDRILSFGLSSHGRLGCGRSALEEEDGDILEEATEIFLPGIADEEEMQVQSVVGGARHTLVLLTNGKLFGFGDNSLGALGHLEDEDAADADGIIATPKLIKGFGAPISMISCASNYTAIVLDDQEGTVIILGSSGLPCATERYSRVPCYRQLCRGAVLPGEKVTEVSAGYQHLLLITQQGKPYAVGANDVGQLGCLSASSERDEVEMEPVEVRFEQFLRKPVAQVAAGESHSMLLTRDGELFTWGGNSFGQLGQRTFSRAVCVPQQVKLPVNCFPIIITCGNNHSIVLDLDGKILTCGNNGFGQTGSTSPFFATNVFGVVRSGEFAGMELRNSGTTHDLFRSLIHIAAGKDHTAVMGKTSRLFMFGRGDKCGGDGTFRARRSAKRANSFEPSLVDLSGTHVKKLDKDSLVFYSSTFRRNTSNAAFFTGSK